MNLRRVPILEITSHRDGLLATPFRVFGANSMGTVAENALTSRRLRHHNLRP
jgi:hypothetical protein